MTRVASLLLLVSIAACTPGVQPQRVGLPPHLRPENAMVPGTLTVEIEGIPSVSGQLFVELYDERTYFKYAEVLNEKIVPVTGASMIVPLEHVPAGRYIVAVSHDANANHAMDTGLFGIPTEAYGFSRAARGTFGPPAFADGAFDFPGTGVVRIALR